MARSFFRFPACCALLVAGVFVVGADAALVGFYEMEIDLDDTPMGLSVPDSSGTPGANPFTSNIGALAPPGAEGTANGVDGFNNVNGQVLSYPALNSASIHVSGYWRSNESAAQLVGRTTAPAGTKGYSIEDPNDVMVNFYIDDVLYVVMGGTGGVPGGPIDLTAGSVENPAWTKVGFSYDAVSGVAQILADDVLRGTLTVPGGGPMFVEGDEINILVGHGAYPGGGFDGGDMAANTGGIVDQLRFENTPADLGVPGDVDGNELVEMADYHLIRDNFQTNVANREMGDLNRDGIVNLLDFRLWKNNFPYPAGAASHVPEPAGALLAVLALAGLAGLRRRAGAVPRHG